MTIPHITFTCRCAAAMLAGCLLTAGCGSAGSAGSAGAGSGLANPAVTPARPAAAADPTSPLVMGGQVTWRLCAPRRLAA